MGFSDLKTLKVATDIKRRASIDVMMFIVKRNIAGIQLTKCCRKICLIDDFPDFIEDKQMKKKHEIKFWDMTINKGDFRSKIAPLLASTIPTEATEKKRQDINVSRFSLIAAIWFYALPWSRTSMDQPGPDTSSSWRENGKAIFPLRPGLEKV